MKHNKLSKLIPTAVAFAMGVSSVVLVILKQSQDKILPLLAIGVLCLGFVGITEFNKNGR